MMRPFALISVSLLLLGCRAPTPSFDPFAAYGQRRVPPPATGSIGRPDPYYQPTAPATNYQPTAPPVNPLPTTTGMNGTASPSLAVNPQGSYARAIATPSVVAWDATQAPASQPSLAIRSSAVTSAQAQPRPTVINEGLNWKAPQPVAPGQLSPTPTTQQVADPYAPVQAAAVAPALVPTAAPIASQPRAAAYTVVNPNPCCPTVSSVPQPTYAAAQQAVAQPGLFPQPQQLTEITQLPTSAGPGPPRVRGFTRLAAAPDSRVVPATATQAIGTASGANPASASLADGWKQRIDTR